MTARVLDAVVLLSALAILAGAWYFQLVIKLYPCELCLAERWPWYAALALALVALAARPALPWPAVWLVLFLGSALLASYHVGVEERLLPGPTACTGQSLQGLSTADALKRLMNTKAVSCDEVQWRLFGVSLAGWNAIASFALAGLAAATLRRRWR